MTGVGFEAFWMAYPRKVGKKAAAQAWQRLAPDDALAAVIVDAVRAQHLEDRDRQFVPHPATWLNGERWTDEVVALVPYVPPAPLTKAQVRSQRNAAAAAAVIASFDAEVDA
jgi:hypothetical protein